MKALNPYLTFRGNCEEAFNFYKSVFGGEFAFIGRYKEIPPQGLAIPEAAKEKIMHIVFPIGKETVLMGADALNEFIFTPKPTSNVTLSIYFPDEAEARHAFDALAQKGKVTIPLQQTFWAKLYGLCTDQFGVEWMISYGEKGE